MSELRWNALLGQWVATATDRNTRTFLPPAECCPLCPTQPGGFESEIPAASYDIAVFENRFPSLRTPPPEPALPSAGHFIVAPATGVCEVVVYTQRHDATLADLPFEQVRKLVDVWAERYDELGARQDIAYVYVFENKGEEMGVTLHHPHGQIYAYPFIPPVVVAELEQFAAYEDEQGECLLCDLRADEVAFAKRIVTRDEHFTSYVPFAARYPYEVHIVSNRHTGALSDLESAERDAFTRTLLRVVRAYDRLFDRSFPYVMAMHQRPSQPGFSGYHLHVEFYPPLRSERRLKFLAGSEIGAGMFINDTLPEQSAARLREVLE
ncbi:MAG TPA: galactose-1-phosphate uridylyltransferase [Candidatus Aquilonibacter sp.]|nr:galactose-1-phosphate uridylyltransferase [Candidatus Aquilonibacter sp.]